MLQIITGKFFKKAERHQTSRKAVLFSNYDWIQPIATCVGTLESIDSGGGIATWVFSYVNQMENEGGKFSIVRVGDDEIVEQFRLLLIFGLRAHFGAHRYEVEHYCRQTRTNVTDDSVPSQMLSRYFSAGLMGKPEDPQNFAKLVEKTISLKRERYLTTMAALQTFCSALEATSTSIDLAYSMLIYALESLAQGFDGYLPIWSDYDEKIRGAIDGLLAPVSADISTGVRTALLQSSHLKLSKRFISFVEAHTDDSFFIREAEGVKFAIRKPEFVRAVKNAYIMRSGYVHELKPIISQLRVPTISQHDAFRWDDEPYLTVSGLARLTAHVLKNFIERGESVASEDVNWRGQLPGVIKMKMSPEYWIHNPQGFTPQNAHARYSVYLEYFVVRIAGTEPITDMTAVMEKIEQTVPAAGTERQKTAMLCLYWVFNGWASKKFKRPKWDKFLTKYKNLLAQCCIDTFAARLVLGGKIEWGFDACHACYTEYDQMRFNKSATHLPSALETVMLATLANKALTEGKNELHVSYLKKAILNCPGLMGIQKLFLEALDKNTAIDCEKLLFGEPKTPKKSAAKVKNA